MIISNCYTLLPANTINWRIKDYKIRILNILNKENFKKEKSFLKLEDVEKLVFFEKRKNKDLNDLEILKKIYLDLKKKH